MSRPLAVMAIVWIARFSQGAFASEPLFQAIDEHQEHAAIELVESGKPDLKARNARGDTALHRAVETGLRQVTRSLLAAGADPHARTRNGETALHLAALHAEPDFADLLLAAGADPRAQNRDGETPLHWAALSGHIVVAQRLLARGADAKQNTRNGQSARDYARRERHPEIVKLLERFEK